MKNKLLKRKDDGVAVIFSFQKPSFVSEPFVIVSDSPGALRKNYFFAFSNSWRV